MSHPPQPNYQQYAIRPPIPQAYGGGNGPRYQSPQGPPPQQQQQQQEPQRYYTPTQQGESGRGTDTLGVVCRGSC